MKFHIEKGLINLNTITRYSDESFGYKELIEPWDFQIVLESSGRFIMNFDSKTLKCTSIEGHLLGNIAEKTTLTLPICEDGGLFVNALEDVERFGIEYEQISKKLYHDKRNNIFAIGEIDAKQLFHRIGIGQYVALDTENNINCVIVSF